MRSISCWRTLHVGFIEDIRRACPRPDSASICAIQMVMMNAISCIADIWGIPWGFPIVESDPWRNGLSSSAFFSPSWFSLSWHSGSDIFQTLSWALLVLMNFISLHSWSPSSSEDILRYQAFSTKVVHFLRGYRLSFLWKDQFQSKSSGWAIQYLFDLAYHTILIYFSNKTQSWG